jgi:GntR family transcriptional repressor for pyruvate dehydrogenase complex
MGETVARVKRETTTKVKAAAGRKREPQIREAAPSVAGQEIGIGVKVASRTAAERLGEFRPVRIRKAADVVVDILVDAIRNGLYNPGDKLPRERDLAAQLEVSRTTAREATSILQRAGVLSVRRGNGGGAVVLTRAIPPSLLSSVQRLPRAEELRSLLEVRRPLELLAGVLAARRGTDEDFAAIGELITELAALTHAADEFMHYDYQVHKRIAPASKHDAVALHLDEIYKQQAAIRSEYPVETFSPIVAVRLHWAAHAALVERDELSIVRVIDEHLASVEEHIFGERLDLGAPFVGVGATSATRLREDGRRAIRRQR